MRRGARGAGSSLPRDSRGIRGRIVLGVAVGLSAVALIGCGGDDDSGSEQAGGAGGADATLVTREVSGYGDALVTPSGRPVYLLTSDPENGSECAGRCAREWRPLTAEGEPVAGPGVDQEKLSTFTREDGAEQVAYGGHALYTHTGPATASWAGTESDGGIWYLVSPAGEPIETTASGGY